MKRKGGEIDARKAYITRSCRVDRKSQRVCQSWLQSSRALLSREYSLMDIENMCCRFRTKTLQKFVRNCKIPDLRQLLATAVLYQFFYFLFFVSLPGKYPVSNCYIKQNLLIKTKKSNIYEKSFHQAVSPHKIYIQYSSAVYPISITESGSLSNNLKHKGLLWYSPVKLLQRKEHPPRHTSPYLQSLHTPFKSSIVNFLL